MDENNNQIDFSKLMEQAAALSKIFSTEGSKPGGSETQTGDAHSGGDMSKILEAVQLFKTLNNSNTNTAAKPNTETQSDVNAASIPAYREENPVSFDERLYSPALNAMKAAIPFLDQRYQKNMSIFIKLIEIQKVMELYGGPNAVVIQSASGSNWQKGLLSAVRPHMDRQKQNLLDLIIKLLEVNEIMLEMKHNGRYSQI